MIVDLGLVALGPASSDLAAERADLPLEVPDAGLARVTANDGADRRVAEVRAVGRQPVVDDLLGDQVLDGDLELLFLGVTRELEHLHPIAQRRRHRVEHVGGRDEEDLGQVERDVEVVVAERVVLLRVEHLEQRRRRVAAEVRPELVNLVEDEDGVLRFGAAQPLDDLARAARRCTVRR